MMRIIDGIVVHCAATKPSMDIGMAEIDQWHRARGFDGIGYHYVIRRSGIIEMGRPLDQVGAHVAGHNAKTVGICLVGGIDDAGKPANNFAPIQFQSLAFLIPMIKSLWLSTGPIWVLGHRDLFVGKACPSFDVERWISAGMPTDWTGEK